MNITHAIPGTAAMHQNELLSALLANVRNRAARHLALIDLPFGAVLNQTDSCAYFPNDALVSLQSVIENGKSVEIGMVGSEGLIGIDGMIGGRYPYIQAKVQCAGTAFRVPNRLLRREFNRHVDLRWMILRYLHSMISQIGQAATCYRHHSIEQQLCRKLLMSSDRLCSDELVLTQTTIADLLGVRREGVTAAAVELRKLGVIDYYRGHIRILDRAKLEERSCECWAVLQAQCHQFRPSDSRAATIWADFASTKQAAVRRQMQAPA